MTIKKYFFIITVYILLFTYYVTPIHAASFKLSPASATFSQACTSSVDIFLDTENGISNAADIKINYDSSKIDIVQIKPGNVYSNYFGNIVDANSGIIRLTGATFDNTFNGHGVFATIIFKPKVSTGNSSFEIFYTGFGSYNSLDSNIADATTSNDLLSTVQNGFYAFDSQSCTTDKIPPAVSFISPINNQTNVPSTANVVVDISDAGSGIDINTVTISLNGIKYSANSPQVTYTGSPSLYHFTLKPLSPLNINYANVVAVSATDFSGNSKQKSITFNLPAPPVTPAPAICITPAPELPNVTPTIPVAEPSPIPDTQSPQITFLNPQAKQTISLTPQIKFNLNDASSGLDLNTLQLIINDQTITNSDPSLITSGSNTASNISYQIKNALTPDTDYNLTVFISDLAGNSLSQSIMVHTTVPFNYRLAGFLKSLPSFLPLLLLCLFILGLIFYLLHLLGLYNQRHSLPYGQVIDSTTLEPIPNFPVQAFNDQNKLVKSTRTNIFGIYSFDLTPGKYQFIVSKIASEFVTISSAAEVFIDFKITPTTTPKDDRRFSFLTGLPPHGFVFNSAGHLQPNITINLLDSRTKTIITSRITNSIGQYRFLLPPGRYLVEIPTAPQANFTVDTRHLTSGYTIINKNLFL